MSSAPRADCVSIKRLWSIFLVGTCVFGFVAVESQLDGRVASPAGNPPIQNVDECALQCNAVSEITMADKGSDMLYIIIFLKAVHYRPCLEFHANILE